MRQRKIQESKEVVRRSEEEKSHVRKSAAGAEEAKEEGKEEGKEEEKSTKTIHKTIEKLKEPKEELKEVALRQSCETEYRAMLDRPLGSGRFAQTYEACLTTELARMDCDYVIRVENITKSNQWEEGFGKIPISEQIHIATLMGRMGVGPVIHDAWICNAVDSHKIQLFSNASVHAHALRDGDKYFFLRMEKLRGRVLSRWWRGITHSREEREQVRANIFKQMAKMHEAGVLHGDLHDENVIVLEPSLDVRFIDWELSAELLEVDETFRLDERNTILKYLK